jgi:hypothetical protein
MRRAAKGKLWLEPNLASLQLAVCCINEGVAAAKKRTLPQFGIV